MQAAKRDGNHKDMVTKLRSIPGMVVFDSGNVGHGFPDLVVGWMGHIHLVEIKDGLLPPSKRKLTPDEIEFHKKWKGFPVHVVNSFDEALEILQAGAETAPF